MIYDVIYTFISPFWHFFRCVRPGEWLMVLAEVCVAWVIFLELEHSRDNAFHAKATNKDSDEDRRKIYQKFLSLTGSNAERVKAFDLELQKAGDEADCLRRRCHNQLAIFNEMGYQTDRWLKFKRTKYVSVFPHAPVLFWFICGAHVRARRSHTGPWFGYHALNFIRASAAYILKYNRSITLRLPGEKNDVTLTVPEMRQLEADLTELIAENSFWSTNWPFSNFLSNK